MDFLRRTLKHIYRTPSGEYTLVNEREYALFVLDADYNEWISDYAEIDAFEAPLFEQGLLTFVEDIYDVVQFPDGSTSAGASSGYLVILQGPGPEKPVDLIHPLYTKWAEKMKADPNMVEYREGVWVE